MPQIWVKIGGFYKTRQGYIVKITERVIGDARIKQPDSFYFFPAKDNPKWDREFRFVCHFGFGRYTVHGHNTVYEEGASDLIEEIYLSPKEWFEIWRKSVLQYANTFFKIGANDMGEDCKY